MPVAWLVALVACVAPGPPEAGPALGGAPLAVAPDRDPTPGRFETDLTAAAARIDIDGEPTDMLAFNGTIPGPLLRVTVGDAVAIHVTNDLPTDEDWYTGIHWHGIEGYNASDGTPTTDGPIAPHTVRDYAFVATRAGLQWYHPHHRGAQALFSGLYGPLVVVDPDEATLIDAGVLPADERVLVLSDTWSLQGVVPSVEVDDGLEQMNGTEGPQVLVNGAVAPELTVAAGGAVRLRVVNSAITRFFRLSVPGKILYRVGGEGGLLDAVHVEGGAVTAQRFDPDRGNLLGTTTVSLGYDRGEILLAPGERADIVLVTDGEPGEVWPLQWVDTARGRHQMWVEDDTLRMADADDDGTRPSVDIASIRLVDAPTEPFTIDEGDPLLTRLGRAVPRADDSAAIDWLGANGVTLDESMDHRQAADGSWTMTTWFGMNQESWHPDHHAGPDQPEAPGAKHAQLGDTLRWEIHNTTGMSHPYHLHGFSMQPYAWVQWPDPHEIGSDGAAARVDWAYQEWEDTLLLPGHSSVFVRVVLADPAGDGSAAGRWMQHCHILQHGENGMMSELVVEP